MFAEFFKSNNSIIFYKIFDWALQECGDNLKYTPEISSMMFYFI